MFRVAISWAVSTLKLEGSNVIVLEPTLAPQRRSLRLPVQLAFTLREKRGRPSSDEFSLFERIESHVLDEGYADRVLHQTIAAREGEVDTSEQTIHFAEAAGVERADRVVERVQQKRPFVEQIFVN